MPVNSQMRWLLEQRASLTREQARALMQAILAGHASELEIAAILGAIAARGETPEELAGLVDAMRLAGLPTPVTEQERSLLVDTCGTGGDGADTFNISTAAALVAAAAGAKVAKHGNRAVTSKCGSADVLEALGVAVDLPVRVAVESLRATGFMFLYAARLHPAMKRVAPVRRQLGFRTIFNLAGPLTNPAGARAQVMGVFAADRIPLVAESMANLGARHAFVVHGLDGLDELTLSGESMVAEVRGSGHKAREAGFSADIRHFRFDPRHTGLPVVHLEQLRGGSTAAENAAILEAMLLGEVGPKRDIVLLNAAAALVVSGVAVDFREGIERGAAAIDSGAAAKTLAALREFSKMNAARS
jgi:anthranilate phosphoribosyltransferase